MSSKELQIGIDRFLSLRWADYALDLLVSESHIEDKYTQLKVWLEKEISGKDACRKTANQLSRLWFKSNDDFKILRQGAMNIVTMTPSVNRAILHYGMAINVFPLFRETCQVIGRLANLQEDFTRKEVQQRVLEKFSNPTSIPRIVDRIIQTLIDWNIVSKLPDAYSLLQIDLTDHSLAGWFTEALIYSTPGQRIPWSDFSHTPTRLRVKFNEREAIRVAANLSLEREGINSEIIAWDNNKN